ncbi:hypothetical protein BKA63DRAFT_113459 [Paraphoma chrysanthemicola]|nr:hypothetical protein BKA63DRAFT_113459 [Paraphoma chrysanthemicola]
MNETAGSTGSTVTDYNTSRSINAVKYRDNFVYTNVRRFVVVRQKQEFCFACPIFTYSGRGTTKPGVRPEEHGIAFTWGQDPQLLPGEVGIEKASIPVVMADGHKPLDKACRVYYGIHHPIQYNVKVKEVGYVPSDAVPQLIGNWRTEDNGGTRQAVQITANAEISDEGDSDDDAARLLEDKRGSTGDQNRPRFWTHHGTTPPSQNAYNSGKTVLSAHNDRVS